MNEKNSPQKELSKISKARANKKVRLILIVILLLIAAYLLYSIW
jgi:hypothetical protein